MSRRVKRVFWIAQTFKEMRVAFVHPDLGLGGAERLVIDAAVGLQELGHRVSMYTTFHDPTRCFPETKPDGCLKVVTYGAWIPRHCCGLFHILFAIVRMLYCCVRAFLCCLGNRKVYDVIIVDQVSACIPLIRLLSPRSRVVFYCHFPDQLLSKHDSCLKRCYRFPVDLLEEFTTSLAHLTFVNSQFTLEQFHKTFSSINTDPIVLYPAVNLSDFDRVPEGIEDDSLYDYFTTHIVFSSVNRFERKKNHPLALESFVLMRDQLPYEIFSDCRLVFAGGYDERLEENVNVMKELKARATELEVLEQVDFYPSFSLEAKYVIFHHSRGILYTPENEHFGIVPIEAQCCKVPVICCNSGGPLESVTEGGYLVEPVAEEWAERMVELVRSEEGAREMGEKGREWIDQMFSTESFARQLQSHLEEIVGEEKDKEKKVKGE